jgi:selenocysteine lyase/cysteine desulfurase
VPYYLKRCAELLRASTVKAGTTIGFPHGGHTTAIKVDEARQALDDGGAELDMVVNISKVLSGDWDYVRADIRAVVDLAHERGALVLADGAQSVGQIPVDVIDLECDFYAMPGHKWLLGPAGTGALYITGDLIRDVQPSKVAYHAVEFLDYAGAYKPRTDIIQKFELTTSSIPLFVGLAEAIAFARGIGLVAIQERVLRLSDLARCRLAEIPGVRLVSPAGGPLATGLLSFAVEGVAPQDVTASLWELGRVVGRTVYETGATRLCTHFFNTEQEAETAVGIVRRVAEQGLPPGLPPRKEGFLPSTKMEKTAYGDL